MDKPTIAYTIPNSTSNELKVKTLAEFTKYDIDQNLAHFSISVVNQFHVA